MQNLLKLLMRLLMPVSVLFVQNMYLLCKLNVTKNIGAATMIIAFDKNLLFGKESIGI